MSVVGKVFCKILNNRLVECLDRGGILHEGQAGFRANKSCMDNVFTLNELVQGRLRENKHSVQKPYDTVWHDGKLWVKGSEVSRSAVLLEGEKSTTFTLEQGVAQGCSLSPILFSDDLLREVDLGIQLGGSKKVGGMLFADDFVGVSGSKEGLQKLISVVHGYCNKWRLRANVCKSAVMVFSRNPVEGEWKWGEHLLPRVSNYFACNGAWDVPI